MDVYQIEVDYAKCFFFFYIWYPVSVPGIMWAKIGIDPFPNFLPETYSNYMEIYLKLT